jgi:ubiquinone/menaquinone biosynthesis C-methylase UbiE
MFSSLLDWAPSGQSTQGRLSSERRDADLVQRPLLGDLYIAKGDRAAAQAGFEKALALEPSSEYFTKRLSEFKQENSAMDETQQYFNDVAGQWDQMRRQFFGDGVRRAAVAAAQIAPGAVVVDVGTGTGFLADAALEAGARVIGVDASEGMLEQVRKRFAGAAFEARAGEVDAIPVEDGSADVVLANMVLHHAPDPSHAIAEMTRILKRGGRLIITDADTHTHEWLRTEMHDRWLGFDRVDIARWFREAGLQEVSVTDTHELCTPSSQCGTQAAITIFLASGVKA